jgi:tetratricopeptide (TPR) repeat protein
MYYTSYRQKPKRKSNIFIFLFVVLILLVVIFLLFFSKNFTLKKGASTRYIDNLIERREYDKALKILEDRIKSGENINWWHYYKVGLIYYYQSDYLNSLLYFRTAYFYYDNANVPSNICFYIGDNYYKLGKKYYPYSLAFFEKYMKATNRKYLIPEDELLYKLSIMYTEVEDFASAQKIMSKIYDKYQNDYRFLYYYSIVLKNADKKNEALAFLQRISTNATDLDLRKDAMFLQGKIYIELEQFNKAIEILLQCVDLAPNSDMSYYYLGYCYSCLHDIDTSINYLTKALLINKDNILAKNLLKALQ